MKLMFKTPNMRHILLHISNIHRDKTKSIDDKYLIHPYMIIEVSKNSDGYLIPEMLQVIAMLNHKLNSVRIIETPENYYLTLSIYDILKLMSFYDSQNVFVVKLDSLVSNTLKDCLYLDNPMDSLFNKDRLNYEIDYNPKLDFHIINDMKFFIYDYMKLLSNTELFREDLNELYRITIRLKVPIYIAQDLIEDFDIVNTSGYYSKPNYNRINNANQLELKLSTIANESNVNKDSATFRTSVRKVLQFIEYFKLNTNTDINRMITSLSSCTDVFITLTIQDLIPFLSNKSKFKSYYPELNSIANLLLYMNHMEYIFTGKERS